MKVVEFVTGYTIKEAIAKAQAESDKVHEPVHATINDIVLIINGKTDINKIYNEYLDKLKFKIEIRELKKQR